MLLCVGLLSHINFKAAGEFNGEKTDPYMVVQVMEEALEVEGDVDGESGKIVLRDFYVGVEHHQAMRRLKGQRVFVPIRAYVASGARKPTISALQGAVPRLLDPAMAAILLGEDKGVSKPLKA
jgi:hypothetical protein